MHACVCVSRVLLALFLSHLSVLCSLGTCSVPNGFHTFTLKEAAQFCLTLALKL